MLLLRSVFRWDGTFLSAVTLACSVQAIKGHDVKSPLAVAAVAAGAGGEGSLGRLPLGFLLHIACFSLHLVSSLISGGFSLVGLLVGCMPHQSARLYFFQTGYGV